MLNYDDLASNISSITGVTRRGIATPPVNHIPWGQWVPERRPDLGAGRRPQSNAG
jgi:hypothetical protein